MSLLNIFKGYDGELTVKLIRWMYLDNNQTHPPTKEVGWSALLGEN